MGVKISRVPVLFIALVIMLAGNLSAQVVNTPTAASNPIGALVSWLPILSIAIFISIAIGALLYVLGKLLNDGQLSARGISEIGQSIGSAVFVVIIIVALLFFGSIISHSA